MNHKQHNSRLISVRLSQIVVDKLEEQVKSNHYYSRNAIIEQILKAVLLNFDSLQIATMLRYWEHSGQKYSTEFRDITKELQHVIQGSTKVQ